jgi:putative flippase GtrA
LFNDTAKTRLAKLLSEFIRFGLVGVAGLFVDLAMLRLYVTVIGDLFYPDDRLYYGQAVAWFVAATANWWLNRQFTFRDRLPEPYLRQWLRFLAVNGFGGAANFAVYALFVAMSALCRHYPSLAVIAGTLFGMSFNFVFSRKLVFSRST